jgi:hypothetical protein
MHTTSAGSITTAADSDTGIFADFRTDSSSVAGLSTASAYTNMWYP